MLLVAGTALAMQGSSPTGARSVLAEATEAPETESEGAPSADELARIVDKLKAAGITATASDVSDLAAEVGVGGAVRVLAFANASGKTPAEILAMFQGGKGWGEIAHELNLSIGPGIGWIMGNGGSGGHGNGHDKADHPDASDDASDDAGG